ncbi:hypothetical protein EW146_g10080 [Bondarzewia mesenterica]|uniref:Uncharacterized protein n=1 Tax=Bondarzewia mesenterica TaxID=1095465 RepID=A0A4S4L0N0_9AGAM|nr:hypothetical protein EW146_g10080 [Bondarzewia mesenterica]
MIFWGQVIHHHAVPLYRHPDLQALNAAQASTTAAVCYDLPTHNGNISDGDDQGAFTAITTHPSALGITESEGTETQAATFKPILRLRTLPLHHNADTLHTPLCTPLQLISTNGPHTPSHRKAPWTPLGDDSSGDEEMSRKIRVLERTARDLIKAGEIILDQLPH